MIEFLTEPLQYPFMLRGLMAAIMAGAVCALAGTYMVLRGMVFFGDALAHSILPGVAIGYLVAGTSDVALFWFSTITAVLTSIGIGALTRGAKIKEDTAIGVIFAGMFALGIALISSVRSYSVDLTHFLFGNILSVSEQQLLLMGIFSFIIVGAIIAFYKEFLIITFDPILAATMRMPKQFLEYLLLVLIALTIVVALQTVGVALMLAMLVTPAAAAYLVSKRLPVMMFIAAAIAILSGIIGLYFSYYVNVASGAAIVLTATVLFGVVWSFRSLGRLITKQKI